MKLTPLDIRHKEFKRGMRGYVDGEVDEFLDEVADEFERLFKENIELTERGEALQEKIDQYRNLEETLQNTLVAARRSAEELRANAQKEAQLMLSEAELKARQMVNQSYGDKQAVEKQIVVLQGIRSRTSASSSARCSRATPSSSPSPKTTRRKAAQFAGQAERVRNPMASDAASHASAPTVRPDAPPRRHLRQRRPLPRGRGANAGRGPRSGAVAETQRPLAGGDEARPSAGGPEQGAAGRARRAGAAPRDHRRAARRSPNATRAPRPATRRPHQTRRAPSRPRRPLRPHPEHSRQRSASAVHGRPRRPVADVDSEVDDNAFKW